MPKMAGDTSRLRMEEIGRWIDGLESAANMPRLTAGEIIYVAAAMALTAGWDVGGLRGRTQAASAMVDLLCQNVPSLRRTLLQHAVRDDGRN